MTAAASTFAIAAEQAENLKAALCQSSPQELDNLSPFAACLIPLLEALRWRGDPRRIAEALPHFAATLDLTDLRNALANLGYRTRQIRGRIDHLDERLLPCIYVTDHGDVLVALEVSDGALTAFDGSRREVRSIRERLGAGTAYVIERLEQDEQSADRSQSNWFTGFARRFRALFIRMLGVALVTNITSLVTPLFVMAVYDHVIGSRSASTLGYLILGVSVVLLCEFCLRTLRARSVAYVGARMDYLLGTASFRQILHLAPALTESAPIGGQIARMREFESLRGFFTSPLAAVILDLPFVVITLGVIAMLAGPLVLVPLSTIGLFAIIGVLLVPPLQRRVKSAGAARSARHAFLLETLSKMRAIKQIGGEKQWCQRFRTISADATMREFDSRLLHSMLQTLTHVIMVAAGIATLAGGALMVMEDTMTSGALIATMVLVWRVLSPLQLLFNAFTQVEQVRSGIQRLNQLMRFKTEGGRRVDSVERKVFKGRVTFSRVTLRYPQSYEPALVGVSFEISPGDVVAVTGSNGAGKSSVLKLVAGLYTPQIGAVAIDGIDLRQLDPLELRRTVAYLPQNCHEFFGTLAQNLRLAKPTASDEELEIACRMAAVLDDIAALPNGFETRITEHSINHLPAGFQQRLVLARTYLRHSPIMLLDVPTTGLDAEGDKAFMEAIRHFRGKSTVIMVTHRPSHIQIANQVLFFREGQLELAGEPAEVMPKIPRELL